VLFSSVSGDPTPFESRSRAALSPRSRPSGLADHGCRLPRTSSTRDQPDRHIGEAWASARRHCRPRRCLRARAPGHRSGGLAVLPRSTAVTTPVIAPAPGLPRRRTIPANRSGDLSSTTTRLRIRHAQETHVVDVHTGKSSRRCLADWGELVPSAETRRTGSSSCSAPRHTPRYRATSPTASFSSRPP